MFSIALIFSLAIGLLVGIIIYSKPKSANPVLNILNASETIPTLALLIILLPLFGIGMAPTIVASIIYSILPVARNTYTGLTGVNKNLIEISNAIGLSEREIMIKVRFPMALPLIAGGVRIAIVFTMAVVTLGGLIAAGGLGAPLQTGINLYDVNIILIVGLWIGLLAVILDLGAAIIEKALKARYGR
ncbi:MAG: ABC transporter permease subunit [Candidatus Methanofastidiosum sp.]|nr:ABC transporter permease subunit [Methanofastidiosum sp.]